MTKNYTARKPTTARKIALLKTAVRLQRVAATWGAAQERLCRRIDTLEDGGYLGKGALLHMEEDLSDRLESDVASNVATLTPPSQGYSFDTFIDELEATFPELGARIYRLTVELGASCNTPVARRAPRFETALANLQACVRLEAHLKPRCGKRQSKSHAHTNACLTATAR
jgi:hypothetical protein